jgi:murein DD-endopeptidase MepM/ murein hydrolase activator NlpD
VAEKEEKKGYKDPYKLVLLKEETLEEVGSYRLSLLNVYLLVSTILVITAIIVLALVFFTPLKRLVPGYADITQNREYMGLYNDIKDLEKQVEAQNVYIRRFRAIVTGDSTAGFTPLSPEAQKILDDIPQQAAAVRVRNQGGQTKSNLTDADIGFLYIVSPITGTVSRVFSPANEHYGIDVVAPRNTPVKAVLDGYIITSDWTLATGNTIGIQHSNNMVSFYKHNARNFKKLGSFVKAGEADAIIGNTGELSSGPHLHFELWLDGKPVDPAQFINFD